MGKLLTAIVFSLSLLTACGGVPTTAYTVEQIQEAETLEEKAELSLSNGFQAALAAVRAIDENEKSGIITREAARKYMEKLDPLLNDLNEAAVASENGLFQLSFDKATLTKKAVDLILAELITMRNE